MKNIFPIALFSLLASIPTFALPPGAQIPETQCTVVDDFRKAAGFDQIDIQLHPYKTGNLNYDIWDENGNDLDLNASIVNHLVSLDLEPWVKEVERRNKINPDWTVEGLTFQLLKNVRQTLANQFNVRLLLGQYDSAFVTLQQLQRLNKIYWDKPLKDELRLLLAIGCTKEVAQKYYQLCAIIPLQSALIPKLQKFELSNTPEQMRQFAEDWMLKAPTAIERYQTILKDEILIEEKEQFIQSEMILEELKRRPDVQLTDEEKSQINTLHKELSKSIKRIEDTTAEDFTELKLYFQTQTQRIAGSPIYCPPQKFEAKLPEHLQNALFYMKTFDSLQRRSFETQNYLNLAKSALLLKIQPDDTAHLQNLTNAFDGKPMTLDLDRMVVKVKQLPKLEHFTKGEPIKREHWDYFPLKLKLETPEK